MNQHAPPAPWAMDAPVILAHRGVSGRAPENTLAAIRRVPAAGARWLEFDVRLTSDDVAVVIHDDSVDATTNGHGRVSALSAAAIERLDAGSWFAGEFRGEKVPTLRAVLEEAALLGLSIDVELKAEPRREVKLARAVAAELARYWPSSAPPPLVTSGSARALRAFHQLAPNVPLGVVLENPPPDWRRDFSQVPFSVIVINAGWINAGRLRSLKRHGASVLAYTVNRRRQARALIALGVDGVFSDYPDVLSGAELPAAFGPATYRRRWRRRKFGRRRVRPDFSAS